MTSEKAEIEASSRREFSCRDCCGYYAEAVSLGVGRKKTLSSNVNTVLKTNLRRCLSTIELVAYGLAAMLGGSIYVLTGTVMKQHTGPAVFLAYLTAGVVALLNALVYSELACRIPKAGSSYSYAYIILGELIAFLTGWSVLLEYILSAATVARGWSSMLDGLTGGKISTWIIQNIGRLAEEGHFLAEYPDFIGALLIFAMASVTCCGVQGSARVTGLFIGINVCTLIAISIFMFIYTNPKNLNLPIPAYINATDLYSPNPSFLPFGISGLIGGVAICFNAFIGFDSISTCAEETANPSKSMPRANFIAVFTVTLVTMTASLALAMYYPWYLASIEVPFLSVLTDNVNGGPQAARNGMFYFVGCGCIIGLTSSLLSNLVAGPRVSYAMAEDGLLPSFCARVCKPFQTPAIATAFIAVITAVLDIIFSIESLADFLSLGTLMAYSIASIGLLVLRYGLPPELRVKQLPRAVSVENLSSREINKELMRNLRLDKQIMLHPEDPIDRVGWPGYLKDSWARFMPTCCSRWVNKGSPGRAVSILTGIYITLNILLIILLSVGSPKNTWPIWRLIVVPIVFLFMILCIIFMTAYEQFDAPRSDLFRLPFVPVFPCITLSVNMFLIAELSWITWIRFAIWTAIGLFIYFTYGVCHSNAAIMHSELQSSGTSSVSSKLDEENEGM